MKSKAFTLAEVLITLAIIGVVAALTIPSVIANTQQQEFKTGLKKAVSVLNSAITMNMALDGESPYENSNLYGYLGRHMSVMKSWTLTPASSNVAIGNVAFYTTDGMRFEAPIPLAESCTNFYLYEEEKNVCLITPFAGNSLALKIAQSLEAGRSIDLSSSSIAEESIRGNCGSYGLGSKNTDATTKTPCYIVVDVNGDRKPFPKNSSCYRSGTCSDENVRKYSDPTGRKLTDTFMILITDKQAIPYGTAAQKAMYESQK